MPFEEEEEECLSQKTAFCTAGSHKVNEIDSEEKQTSEHFVSLLFLILIKPIEVKKQSLARVAQIMSTLTEDKENNQIEKEKNRSDYTDDFDGDDIDDDLVFSTVPDRSTKPISNEFHFDEIDDEEMRRAAESLEQEQQENDFEATEKKKVDAENDRLCQDYEKKLQTPTKSTLIESKKRKKRCLEDLDALLDDQSNDSNDCKKRSSEDERSMSPVFKKKS